MVLARYTPRRAPFAIRGVIVLRMRGEEIISGRLYMEPVEQDGTDIDEMVRETYRPPEAR